MPEQPKAISREAIVSTAVDLMIERGLEAVTLRRIATELGVSAPTLYWYISSKRALLDHVAEHLMEHCRTEFDERPTPGQPWWEWLERRARTMFDVMVGVRDAPQVMAGNRPTVDQLSHIDGVLGELVAVGFPVDEALNVLFVLGGYVGGMALEYQAEKARADVDDAEFRDAVADSTKYPHLSAVSQPEHMHTVDYGLDLLIRGIRARHAELTTWANGTPVPSDVDSRSYETS